MLPTIVRELFNQRIDNYNFRNFSYFDMRNVNGEWGIGMGNKNESITLVGKSHPKPYLY